MSKYSDAARHYILDILNREDIWHIEVRTSRLSSSIFSIPFWVRIIELLTDKNKTIDLTFSISHDIAWIAFTKIENQIEKALHLLKLDLTYKDIKGKIAYKVDPNLIEDEIRQDGIKVITNANYVIEYNTFNLVEEK